jgi:hypothetical protein
MAVGPEDGPVRDKRDACAGTNDVVMSASACEHPGLGWSGAQQITMMIKPDQFHFSILSWKITNLP